MFDVVIVGQGAAGLAAAATAIETVPSLRVAVLERAPEEDSGGNTRWSPSNMRMRAVDVVLQGFEADMMEATGGRGDSAYFRRLAEDAPETLTWLTRQGVEFHAMDYFLSNWPTRLQPVGKGAAIVEALKRSAKDKGVEFHYGCRATRLLLGPDGHVEGVETDQGHSIPTRSVILASGGFQGDPEMLREHLGSGAGSLRMISPGTPWNGGDGIRMALDVGAKRSGDWAGMHIEPVDPRSARPAALVLAYPYGIVVDGTGRRFFDEGEGLVHSTWERLCRTIHFECPGRTAWTIVDAKATRIEGYRNAIRTDVPPISAESAADLASKLGVASDALEATIATFNAACREERVGFDPTRLDGVGTAEGFAPPKSNWARPVDEPPFLAFPIVGAIVYTFGGLATDIEARVLDAKGPIPGLYAAGEITGHFYGMAPNAVSVMRSLVFGRIAGRNASQALRSLAIPRE